MRCESCAEANEEREATCYLDVAPDCPLCGDCARELRQGIHDGTMGGNPGLTGTWPNVIPLR